MRRFDVAVVGCGVMGAATARSLARRGPNVVAFERFEVGHDRGSSHGPARIFRFSYRAPQYVEMAQQALPMWRGLESEADEPFFTTTGGLDMGAGIDGNVAALTQCGATFEMLDGGEARRRWPTVKFDPQDEVLYQPDAALIAADRAWNAFVQSARERGAAIEEQRRVTELVDRSDGVVLKVDDEEIRADVCVVTAGAWSKPLLERAGIELDVSPSLETIVYLKAPGPPLPLVEWGSPAAFALPSLGYGDDVIRTGFHIAGPTTDPETEGTVEPAAVAEVVDWVTRRIEDVDPSPVVTETCIYTNTDDEHFVLERHGGIVVGSPCSGHGFKFAPLIGERLADLALS
ncbi:MAG: FAD-dependent oxidoreductase [Actinomycetota bacterium]